MQTDANLIGAQMGQYKIISALGKGGMGAVYLGEDLSLRRRVAIKVLPNDFAEDDKLRQRFLREPRACARLNHPGIVTIYGVARHENAYFIAMELVEGQTLKNVIGSQAPMPVRRALEIAREVAEALQEAHRQGIVHRDIKPDNIMLTRSNRVKVMDFGLARFQNESTALTQTGFSVGTPLYMSPEQWKDSKVDERSDIYSLGAVLFEMLSDSPPFTANSTPGLMRKILDEPAPRLGTLNSSVPLRAEEIVSKTLAKEPTDRYSTAEEFIAAIDAYVLGAQSGTLPAVPDFPEVREQSSISDVARGETSTVAPVSTVQTAQPVEVATGEGVFWRRRRFQVSVAVTATVIAAVGIWAAFSRSPRFAPAVFPQDNFVWIEPGTFIMGSPEEEPGHAVDELVHFVRLTHGFWMSKYEVTQEQWESVMGDNPSGFRGPNRPVERVSWNDVQEFFSKLNAKFGTRFRLPTEAEWEYASRAGTSTAYAFGDNPEDLKKYGWYLDNSAVNGEKETWPVGMKRPNPWGLYDISGNVSEWCSDWLGAYRISDSTDPAGPQDGQKKVGRGGSYGVNSDFCRSADRSAMDPSGRGPDVGFRMVTD